MSRKTRAFARFLLKKRTYVMQKRIFLRFWKKSKNHRSKSVSAVPNTLLFLPFCLPFLSSLFALIQPRFCHFFSFKKVESDNCKKSRQGKITKRLKSISCARQMPFEQNTQWGQNLPPFLSAFFSNLLYLIKVLLGSLTIFLSSYLKRKKTVAFWGILVL